MGKEMNINNVRMKLEIYQESGIIRIADCTAGDSLLHEGIIIESTTDSITVVVKKSCLTYMILAELHLISKKASARFAKVQDGGLWTFHCTKYLNQYMKKSTIFLKALQRLKGMVYGVSSLPIMATLEIWNMMK